MASAQGVHRQLQHHPSAASDILLVPRLPCGGPDKVSSVLPCVPAAVLSCAGGNRRTGAWASIQWGRGVLEGRQLL